MCEYFYIVLIDFMLAGKTLIGFTSLCPLWFWKKWQYNSELFQKWIKSVLLK